jgi:hypothetical protein
MEIEAAQTGSECKLLSAPFKLLPWYSDDFGVVAFSDFVNWRQL